jgi:membrane protease YdiL (CAAX protease family)
MKKRFLILKDRSLISQLLILITFLFVGFLIAISLGAIAGMLYGGMEGLQGLAIPDFHDKSTINLLKIFQIFSQVGLFVLPAFMFAYYYQEDYQSFLKIRCSPDIKCLLIAIIAIVLMMPSIGFLVDLNQGLKLPSFMQGIEEWMKAKEEEAKIMTEAFLQVSSVSALLLNLFMIGLLAGLGEELLFRGVLQNIFLDKWRNPHVAIWSAAIIFSAFHLQFYGFLPRMVLGAIFGYIYLWTNNLWIPVTLHTIFNSITVVGAFLFQRGIINTDMENIGTSDSYMVVAISFVAALGLFRFIYRLSLRKRKGQAKIQ